MRKKIKTGLVLFFIVAVEGFKLRLAAVKRLRLLTERSSDWN